MSKRHKGISLITPRSAAAIALLGFAPGAFAYLDPSTGSMILSAIVGIFATLSLAIKTYWYKLKAFFTGKKRDSSDPAADSQPAEPAGEDGTPRSS